MFEGPRVWWPVRGGERLTRIRSWARDWCSPSQRVSSVHFLVLILSFKIFILNNSRGKVFICFYRSNFLFSPFPCCTSITWIFQSFGKHLQLSIKNVFPPPSNSPCSLLRHWCLYFPPFRSKYNYLPLLGRYLLANIPRKQTKLHALLRP